MFRYCDLSFVHNLHMDIAFYAIDAYNRSMRVIENPKTKEQEPEVLDAATLAAIDKVDRWEPSTEAVTFDQALDRARERNKAWRNADQDLSA